MLARITYALVALALVTLIVGFFQRDSNAFLYTSIVLSLAAIVAVIFAAARSARDVPAADTSYLADDDEEELPLDPAFALDDDEDDKPVPISVGNNDDEAVALEDDEDFEDDEEYEDDEDFEDDELLAEDEDDEDFEDEEFDDEDYEDDDELLAEDEEYEDDEDFEDDDEPEEVVAPSRGRGRAAAATKTKAPARGTKTAAKTTAKTATKTATKSRAAAKTSSRSKPAASSSRGKVSVVPGRDRYHSSDCRFIVDKDDVEELTAATAKRRGYQACSVCKP